MASLFHSSNSSSPSSTLSMEIENFSSFAFTSKNHSPETSYRKRKSPEFSVDLTLSSNFPSEFHKPRESKINSTIDIEKSGASTVVSWATRNLLDKSFFSGIKTETFDEDQGGVSTELSLSLSEKNSKDDYNKAADDKSSRGGLVDAVSGGGDKRVSTKLCLFDESWMNSSNSGASTPAAPNEDPWKIKKTLKESDVGNLSRLLLPSESVNSYILPVLRAGEDKVAEKEGIEIQVWDCDTENEHKLIFKRWGSSKSYVFVGGWIPNFVKRRNLKQKDTVGFYWDHSNSRFNFSVLQKHH